MGRGTKSARERSRERERGRGRAAKKSLLTRTTFSQSEIQNQTVTTTTTTTLGCPMDTVPLSSPRCTAASTCCYLCQRKITAPHSGMKWKKGQTKVDQILYKIYIKSTK